jgi:hypothetical protein
MTRKAFLALCGSVLAAPCLSRTGTAPSPKPPDPPRFAFTPTREFDAIYRQILDGQRLYGLGVWDTHKGDSH